MDLNPAFNNFEQYRLDAQFRDDCTTQTIPSSGNVPPIRHTWKRARSLGGGGFGKVWQETLEVENGDRQYRAVKVYSQERMREAGVDYKMELSAMAAFSGSKYAGYFVSLHGWWVDSTSIFLAMEYLGKGDLSIYIPSGIEESEVKEIMHNVLSGLGVMHREGFTHRDIKPQNILVVQKRPEFRKWWVKIGDFGTSKRIPEGSSTVLHTSVGTRPYCAPEVLGYLGPYQETSIYCSKVDMWSLGGVLFNIGTRGRVPFSESGLVRYCDGTQGFNPGGFAIFLNEYGISLIRSLLNPNPEGRLSAVETLQHSWFTSRTDPLVSAMDSVDLSSSTDTSSQERTQHGPQCNYNSFLSSTTSFVHNENSPHPTHLDLPNRNVGHTIMSPAPYTAAPQQFASPVPYLSPNMHAVASPGSLSSAFGGSTIENTSQPTFAPPVVSHPGTESTSPTSVPPPTLHAVNGSTPFDDTISRPEPGPMSRPKVPPIAQYSWKKVRKVRGDSPEVSAVAFSPDRMQIASASADRTVRLWDLATVTVTTRSILQGHLDEVCAVTFSPDGKQIASASRDTTIRLWDLATATTRSILQGHLGMVLAVAFSPPDGKQIASGSRDRTVRLWDLATATTRSILQGHLDEVCGVAFSPDGKQIASASRDTTVRLWDSATGTARGILQGHLDEAWAVAFSPDGKQIASISRDNRVRLWDLATMTMHSILQGHLNYIWAIAFSPDGKQIASASHDRTVRLWDSATGKACGILQGLPDKVLNVVFSPDGKRITSVSSDMTIRFWDSVIKTEGISLSRIFS